MHQHLRQFGAVGLVLGLVEHQLHGATEALRVFGNDQGAFARGHPVGHAAPEGHRAVARQRVHEAHRGSALDTVDEHGGELVDLRVIQRMYAPHGPCGGGHRLEVVSDAITTA